MYIKIIIIFCLVSWINHPLSAMKRSLDREEITPIKKQKKEDAFDMVRQGAFYVLWLKLMESAIDLNQMKNGKPLICAILKSNLLPAEEKNDWIENLIQWNNLIPIKSESIANITIENSNKSLYSLAKTKQYAALWLKIQQGLGLNDRDKHGFPFVWNFLTSINMSDELKFKWLDLMIKKGLNINMQKPDNGLTILHAKIEEGSIAAVEKLLAVGADPNIRDNRKRTALHWAARAPKENEESYLAILNTITKSIADLNAIDCKGNIAMHYAAGNKKAANLLIRMGEDFDIKNLQGETPFIFASRKFGIKNKDLKTVESVKENIIFPMILPQTGNVLKFIQERELFGKTSYITN